MKININNVMFVLGFLFIQISNVCVNVSFLKSILIPLKFLGMILLVTAFLLKAKTLKLKFSTFLIIIILAIIGLLSYIQAHTTIFIEFVTVLIGSVGINFDKIIRYDFKIKIGLLIFMLLMYFGGYAASEFTIIRNGAERLSFGFYHPNTFAVFVMILYFEYLVVNSDKHIGINIIIGIIVALFIFGVTNSRTTLIAIIFSFLPILLQKYGDRIMNNSIFKLLEKNIFLILLAFTLIFTILYGMGNVSARNLDTLMTGRLDLQYYYLSRYNINLFGHDILYKYTLDNGFMKMLLNYGLVTCILLLCLYRKNIAAINKNKDFLICILFLIMQFYSLSESYLFYIYINVFWLYFLSYIPTKRRTNDKIINNNTHI